MRALHGIEPATDRVENTDVRAQAAPSGTLWLPALYLLL